MATNPTNNSTIGTPPSLNGICTIDAANKRNSPLLPSVLNGSGISSADSTLTSTTNRSSGRNDFVRIPNAWEEPEDKGDGGESDGDIEATDKNEDNEDESAEKQRNIFGFLTQSNEVYEQNLRAQINQGVGPDDDI